MQERAPNGRKGCVVATITEPMLCPGLEVSLRSAERLVATASQRDCGAATLPSFPGARQLTPRRCVWQTGDVVRRINGIGVHHMSLDEVVGMM